MCNDITNWEVGKRKTMVQLKRKKWLSTKKDSELVTGVYVVQDRKRPGNTMKNDHLTLPRRQLCVWEGQASQSLQEN